MWLHDTRVTSEVSYKSCPVFYSVDFFVLINIHSTMKVWNQHFTMLPVQYFCSTVIMFSFSCRKSWGIMAGRVWREANRLTVKGFDGKPDKATGTSFASILYLHESVTDGSTIRMAWRRQPIQFSDVFVVWNIIRCRWQHMVIADCCHLVDSVKIISVCAMATQWRRDLRFAQRCCWKFKSSMLLHHVDSPLQNPRLYCDPQWLNG